MNIFLATSISSLNSPEKLAEYKKGIRLLADSLISESHSVHSELFKIESIDNYDSPLDSLSMDMTAISKADVFILHYPIKKGSSTLIELGYAIAKEKFIIALIPSLDVLPFMALGLDAMKHAALVIQSEINESCLQQVKFALEQYNPENAKNEWRQLIDSD